MRTAPSADTGWVAFWIYWLVAALSTKKGRVTWSRELRIRAVIVVLTILLLRSGAFRDGGIHSEPGRAGLGLFLFGLGLVFAIWARLHIGRNWGPPMSQKDEPELVTTGPYRPVRHPIYSGILLAGVGTATALNWPWLIAMVLAGVSFSYSATVEERYLTEQFPDACRAYRRSTKMLAPFVFSVGSVGVRRHRAPQSARLRLLAYRVRPRSEVTAQLETHPGNGAGLVSAPSHGRSSTTCRSRVSPLTVHRSVVVGRRAWAPLLAGESLPRRLPGPPVD